MRKKILIPIIILLSFLSVSCEEDDMNEKKIRNNIISLMNKEWPELKYEPLSFYNYETLYVPFEESEGYKHYMEGISNFEKELEENADLSEWQINYYTEFCRVIKEELLPFWKQKYTNKTYRVIHEYKIIAGSFEIDGEEITNIISDYFMTNKLIETFYLNDKYEIIFYQENDFRDRFNSGDSNKQSNTVLQRWKNKP